MTRRPTRTIRDDNGNYRMIIQIAAAGEENMYPLLLALCTDGSVWSLRFNRDNPNAMLTSHWSRVPTEEVEKGES